MHRTYTSGENSGICGIQMNFQGEIKQGAKTYATLDSTDYNQDQVA